MASWRPPPYIPVTAIEKMPVRHRWDDWDPYAILGEPDANTLAQLMRVTDRAQVAYAIGCAEWVAYRFRLLCDDAHPYAFLDACWAAEMSADYATPSPFVEAQWKGPIRAPIDLALVTAVNALNVAEDGAAHSEAGLAERISLHVLPDPSTFLAWRSQALPRLERAFPRQDHRSPGPPVPPMALDPAFALSSDALADGVREFFATLERTQNPYLQRVSQGS